MYTSLILHKKIELYPSLTEGRVHVRSGLGRITVSQYGLYASVCADSWTDVEAEVTCKMLGYRGQLLVFMIFFIRLKVNFLEIETYNIYLYCSKDNFSFEK